MENTRLEEKNEELNQQLNELSRKTSDTLTTKQLIKIYTITVVLAPLGIIYFFKYYKSPDQKKKAVAYICLIITVSIMLSFLALTKTTFRFYETYSTKYLEQYRILEGL